MLGKRVSIGKNVQKNANLRNLGGESWKWLKIVESDAWNNSLKFPPPKPCASFSVPLVSPQIHFFAFILEMKA